MGQHGDPRRQRYREDRPDEAHDHGRREPERRAEAPPGRTVFLLLVDCVQGAGDRADGARDLPEGEDGSEGEEPEASVREDFFHRRLDRRERFRREPVLEKRRDVRGPDPFLQREQIDEREPEQHQRDDGDEELESDRARKRQEVVCGEAVYERPEDLAGRDSEKASPADARPVGERPSERGWKHGSLLPRPQLPHTTRSPPKGPARYRRPEQREPPLVLERRPAEVAEERDVDRPHERPARVRRKKPPPPGHLHRPGSEGDGRAGARDEPRRDPEPSAVAVDHPASPVEPSCSLLAAEEPLRGGFADPAAEAVGGAVAEDASE